MNHDISERKTESNKKKQYESLNKEKKDFDEKRTKNVNKSTTNSFQKRFEVTKGWNIFKLFN